MTLQLDGCDLEAPNFRDFVGPIDGEGVVIPVNNDPFSGFDTSKPLHFSLWCARNRNRGAQPIDKRLTRPR